MMTWKFVANAVRLAEPDASGSTTITHLEDLWTASGEGSASLDPQGVAGLWATTTSTLYVEDGDGDWVFVFHNNFHALGTSLKEDPQRDGAHQSRHAVAEVETSWSSALTASGPLGDLATTTASVTRYLQFQKANYLKFQDGLNPLSTDLESGLGLYEGMSTSPFVATSIPYQTEVNTPWGFQYIQKYRVRLFGPPPFHRGSSTVSFVPVLSTVNVQFYLAFRDVTVIEVPLSVKGGYQWLMIAKRVRVVHGSGTDGHTAVDADQAFSMLGAKECLSDIVVFKSNNPSFQNDDLTNLVKGPYLLVDSLASVEEDQNFRTSNRVPCAVFERSTGLPDLYVYYVVESAVRADGTSGDYSFDYDLGSGVTATQLGNTQDAWAAGSWANNGRGIAVKKIAYDDLRVEVLEDDYPLYQSSWTKNDAVTGELLGLVRVWISAGGGWSPTGVPVRFWEDRFDNSATGVNYTPVKADPCAVWTQDGNIRLFFACFARPAAGAGADQITPANGWGIWHAASIPDGRRLSQSADPMTTTGTFRAVYGKDFIVRPEDAGSWPDMVAASDVSAADPRKWMDADVFLLKGDKVGMLVGCERYFDPAGGTAFRSYGGDPLGRFEGDMADLTWPWTDAFGGVFP